ncbi:extracellular solute-binding protein [Microcoleus asticus]|uniref:Spermidine/putrescine-binding periplasmic protein n=1 Tax=Microcoleus asticus IPMA8 TaxID=2563858 RepID=A0ABX2CTZ9_9CYAN|nr:Spermidine/putrescine-binding periplasmic protein [Microcoleus asticus IPMA8]
MKRRSLLLGAATLTLSQLAAGCDSKPILKIRSLKNSIPAQLVSKFSRDVQPSPLLQVTQEPQLKELFALLQEWKQVPKSKNQADLVMLGDYWLTLAIRQKLIQPIDPAKFANWAQLPERWQKLVRRNDDGQLDPKGKIWGAPYRWGSTVIAYRTDKFKSLGWTPTDWSDLWRSELRDRISLPDSAREVIGLTLKKLGKSYNTQQLDKVPNLKKELANLHQQVKLYSSDAYLQPLTLGDTWLAVGSSGDLLPLLQTEKDIALVIPVSGTALWTDLWVEPASGNRVSLVEKWIDFCLQPRIAPQLSLLAKASSPIIVGMKPEDLPEAVRTNSVLLPDAKILAASEFLLPFGDAGISLYRSLWQEIRQVVKG